MDLQKNQIESLVIQHSSSASSVLDSINVDRKNNLILTFSSETSYLLSMQTKNALNEWDADNFNSFLKENGLG